jgi:hypothetical protein
MTYTNQRLTEKSVSAKHAYEEGYRTQWKGMNSVQIENNIVCRDYKKTSHMTRITKLASQTSYWFFFRNILINSLTVKLILKVLKSLVSCRSRIVTCVHWTDGVVSISIQQGPILASRETSTRWVKLHDINANLVRTVHVTWQAAPKHTCSVANDKLQHSAVKPKYSKNWHTRYGPAWPWWLVDKWRAAS